MSRSVNKVTLIGTVGRDPETRALPSGSTVTNLSLATNDSYLDKNTNQRVEQTEWHRIVAFGKLADIIQQYVRKGGRVYIEGKLRTNEWEKDGIKRYTTEIVANEMVMLDRASDNNQGGYAPQAAGNYQPNYQQPAAPQAAPQAYPQNPGYGYQGAPTQPAAQPAAYPPVQPMQQHAAPAPQQPQAAPQAAPAPAPQPYAPQPAYTPAPAPTHVAPQNNFDSTEDDIPF